MTAVKPNRSEAFVAANKPCTSRRFILCKNELLLHVGNELLRSGSRIILLITLGEQGMILFDGDQPPYHVPPRAREVYDLSGAGDTAIAH